MIFNIFLILPVLVFSCGDVCNEDDGAYTPNKHYNVPPSPECASGYTTFLRPGYKWCMRVYAVLNITQAEAQTQCASDGAVLSGFQNRNENDWIARRGVALAYAAFDISIGAIWLGLRIRDECNFADYASSTACTPIATSSYYWTDGYTTGYDQITWIDGSPGSYLRRCASMLTYSRGLNPGYTVNPLSVQTIRCDLTDETADYPYEKVIAIVCGKLPTIYD